MPFARPTVGELITRARADLRGRLSVDGAPLRRAMIDVLGAVWAGAVHGLYGFLAWTVRQLFVTTCERDALIEHARKFGLAPSPATFAEGIATATGTNGTAIPVDTIIRLDAATAYRVTVGQVIAGGTAALPIKAVLAGAAANILDATPLTLESPIAGVSSSLVAAGDVDGGFDEEGTEAFRARVLLRMREPPEGGADRDYEAWALAVAGVTRAWVYENEAGLGTTVVRFVFDADDGTVTFPDAGALATMQAALDAERPTCARPIAAATTDAPVSFTIHVVPDNADTRAAVLAELRDLFKRSAEPGDGVGRGTVLLSEIRTAIGTAAGVTDYVLTVPAADVVPAVGALPTVTAGSITWV